MQKEPHSRRPLTFKQIQFVNQYVDCMNQSEAARRAGYKTEPRNMGSVLMANPNIRALVEKEMGKRVMQPREVLKRLTDMANANLFPFVRITDDGFTEFDFKHPDAKNHFHIIKKLKTKRKREITGKGDDKEVWEHEWVEVELHDSQAALEKIARHWSLFHDKLEIPQLDQLTEAVKLIGERQANGSKSDTGK